MFSFSNKSLQKLSQAHIDLQLILQEAIQSTRVDFGISETHRSLERQQEMFDKGLSRVDPSKGMKGKHNHYPSMAVDVYAYAGGKSRWDDVHLGYIGGVILTVADKLYNEGKITHKVRWGADWDSDGLLVLDHKLKDLPHFELV